MRVENWDVHLVEFAESVRGAPFVWGETDCVTLARAGLRVILDRDPWHGLLGRWTTKRGAFRVSVRADTGAILKASQAAEVPPRMATAGDLAVGPGLGEEGLHRLSILVPARKALVAFPEGGVELVDQLSLIPGTTFWRYD